MASARVRQKMSPRCFPVVLQEPDDLVQLLAVLAEDVLMADIGIDDMLFIDFQERRFGGKMFADHLFDSGRHGGREEPDIALGLR